MSRVQVLPYHIVALHNCGTDCAPPRPVKPPELSRRPPRPKETPTLGGVTVAPSNHIEDRAAPPLPSKPLELQGYPLLSKSCAAQTPLLETIHSELERPPQPTPRPWSSTQAPFLPVNETYRLGQRTQKGYTNTQPFHSISIQRQGAAIQKTASVSMCSGKRDKVVKFSLEAVLQQVIVDGDKEQFKQLLEEHGKSVVRKSDSAGKPLALKAVEHRKYDILEMLVSHGATLISSDDEGWTPLHAASVRDDMRATKIILRSGQVGVTNSRCLKHLRPIDIAKSEEMASLLLSADLDNFRREQDDLLKHGIIPKCFMTCYKDEGSLVYELLVRNDKDAYKLAWGITDKWHGGLLHLAARKNYPKVATLALERHLTDVDTVNSKGETPLHCAAKQGATDMILLLKQFGADLSIRDKKGNTASYYANPLHCTWLISV